MLGALVLGAAPAAAQETIKLAGNDAAGSPGSYADPGVAEVYRTIAGESGSGHVHQPLPRRELDG